MSYELDETQYAEYMALKNTAAPVLGMVTAIMGNPKARKQLLQARKTVQPDASIPELDAAEPITEAVNEVKAEAQALRKEMAEDKAAREQAALRAKAESDWEKGRSKLRSLGWEEEGIEKIEQIMKDRGIVDHEIAAAYFEKTNPTPEPVVPTSNRFDIFTPPSKEDALNLLFEGQDDRFLNETINKTLADVRSGKGR